MSHKDTKKSVSCSITAKSSGTVEMGNSSMTMDNNISISILMTGSPDSGEWLLLTVFNGQIILETKWQNLSSTSNISLPLNVKDSYHQSLIADQPLIFLLRASGGKGSKEDPLLSSDNKAGGTVDLLPLILGESKINLKVPLISIQTGFNLNCHVTVNIRCNEDINFYKETIPLSITMISAHCLPPSRDGTVYVSAMELVDLQTQEIVVNFGMSLSDSAATNIVWASASNAGQAANTSYNVPSDDVFLPPDLDCKVAENCVSVYWNAMKRILVDSASLRNRLKSRFILDIAGVPKTGKIDVRGRYMALIDAGVLLNAGQYGVTMCAKLLPFNEAYLPENVGTILELPPSSAKTSAREPYSIVDDYGHSSYIVMRFDLNESLISKTKTASYYQIIGQSPPNGLLSPIFELEYMEPPIDNKSIDAKCIKKEEGALAVHDELNKLHCGGTVQMNKSIKRTAANNLLIRLRLLLKQFPLDKIDNWQDIVTAQHKTTLRSVLSSFAPQMRRPKFSNKFSAARSRLSGNTRIATEHVKNSLESAPDHPRVLFSIALRCLEERKETEGQSFLLSSLNSQPRNRYLLWTLGGIYFKQSRDNVIADAAFNIAVKGDVSDGITGTIGWAALHALSHLRRDDYTAFVAAKKMRKCFELEQKWKPFIERWINISGEEELFWDPSAVSPNNPFLIASTFFLCLRCFDFSEKLLQCFENGCSARGSRFRINRPLISSDLYYLRIASLILRKQVSKALQLTEDCFRKFGPSASMSQIRAICLISLRGWDTDCESSLLEADRAGAKPCSFLLYQAALGKLETDPAAALQYAARAHKNTPSAFIALLIGRIYARLGDDHLAVRWTAAAVNEEPLLADGWAVLAILAMRERNIVKAKSMLRTSKQAGPLSPDIENELKKMMKAVKIESLSDLMSKNICFCEYY